MKQTKTAQPKPYKPTHLKHSQKKKAKKGFSMIELLVVATIIIVLSTVGIVSFRQAGISSRNAKRKMDLESVRQALMLYRLDNGGYPPSASLPGVMPIAHNQTSSRSWMSWLVPQAQAVTVAQAVYPTPTNPPVVPTTPSEPEETEFPGTTPAFDTVVEELATTGYLTQTDIKDPAPSAVYTYDYTSTDPNSFQVCTKLEPDGRNYCVTESGVIES